MNDRQVAQAMRLITALRVQVNEMTNQLAMVEGKGATSRKCSVISAMRVEAATLRGDIDEAQILIERLQRRYLIGRAGPAPLIVRPARRVDPPTHRSRRDDSGRLRRVKPVP